ncbi:MAG TPA: hypothetical protein VF635_00955 [Propionibacteriaceae bacterium]
MTTFALPNEFDAAGFSHALEDQDVAAQLAYYSDCAEVSVVTRTNRGSQRKTLHGRCEVATWLTELSCSYPTISTVTLGHQGADMLLIAECRRPDEELNVYAATAGVEGGLIFRQFVIIL